MLCIIHVGVDPWYICGVCMHACMRYESKHAYFKHLAGNFKNILKTLAIRHQRYACLQLLEPSLYLKQAVSARGGMVYCMKCIVVFNILCACVQIVITRVISIKCAAIPLSIELKYNYVHIDSFSVFVC